MHFVKLPLYIVIMMKAIICFVFTRDKKNYFFQELKPIEGSSAFPFFIGGLAGSVYVLTCLVAPFYQLQWPF